MGGKKSKATPMNPEPRKKSRRKAPQSTCQKQLGPGALSEPTRGEPQLIEKHTRRQTTLSGYTMWRAIKKKPWFKKVGKGGRGGMCKRNGRNKLGPGEKKIGISRVPVTKDPNLNPIPRKEAVNSGAKGIDSI